MNRPTQRILVGLVFILLFGLASSTLAAPAPVSKVFKLRAAGQIDLSTGALAFGGVATHLGLYTSEGFLSPTFSIFGTITAANGDTLEFTGFFSFGPLGELQATLNFNGGTGRFAGATGTASGPVTLNPDFTFLITASGNLEY